MKNVLFHQADYKTAATATITLMREMRKEHGDYEAMVQPEYHKAFTLLSIMNSIRDMQLQPGMVYAEADGMLYTIDPLSNLGYGDVPFGKIIAAVYYTEAGHYYDETYYYAKTSAV